MKIEIAPDNLLRWPESNLEFSAFWKFYIYYSVKLIDGIDYEFRSVIHYNSVNEELWFHSILHKIKVLDINWNWRESTTSFTFDQTKFIGDNWPKDMEEFKREKLFSDAFNPFGWETTGDDCELNKNRDLMSQWWRENHSKILVGIKNSKEVYNASLLRCANEILIK